MQKCANVYSMTNTPNQIGPSLMTPEAIQDQADQLAGLSADRLRAQADMLGDAIRNVPGEFDPDNNPSHADLTIRLRGALRAAGAIELEEPSPSARRDSGDFGGSGEPPAPAMMQRVDGSVDLVNAAGQRQAAHGGVPDQANILRSWAPIPPRASGAAAQRSLDLPPTPSSRSRRKVILPKG